MTALVHIMIWHRSGDKPLSMNIYGIRKSEYHRPNILKFIDLSFLLLNYIWWCMPLLLTGVGGLKIKSMLDYFCGMTCLSESPCWRTCYILNYVENEVRFQFNPERFAQMPQQFAFFYDKKRSHLVWYGGTLASPRATKWIWAAWIDIHGWH